MAESKHHTVSSGKELVSAYVRVVENVNIRLPSLKIPNTGLESVVSFLVLSFIFLKALNSFQFYLSLL